MARPRGKSIFCVRSNLPIDREEWGRTGKNIISRHSNGPHQKRKNPREGNSLKSPEKESPKKGHIEKNWKVAGPGETDY